MTGQFFRVDGVTGLVEDTVQIQPQNGVSSNPYGAAVDFYGKGTWRLWDIDIRADIYAPDAISAIDRAREFLGIETPIGAV